MKISPNHSTVNLSRREFLANATAAAAATVTAGAAFLTGCGTVGSDRAGSESLVGTQLYGWGQYYDRERRRLNEHLDEVLSAIRDCGYDYAEGSLDVGQTENNHRFADQLRAKGMRPVSLYTGGRLHEAERVDDVVGKLLGAAKSARQAGFFILNCNPDPIGREKTDAELLTQAAALRRLGTGLKELGLRLGLHHHTPELRHDGREFHHNFQKNPAGLVDFCYDVHWVYRGGIAPMDALKQYGDRVVSWHLRQSRDQIWWEDLAPGDIDYAAVAAVARQRHLPAYYTVELALENGTKITRGVVENHRRSRDYVREIFKA
jgi:inosose dehydratase